MSVGKKGFEGRSVPVVNPMLAVPDQQRFSGSRPTFTASEEPARSPRSSTRPSVDYTNAFLLKVRR